MILRVVQPLGQPPTLVGLSGKLLLAFASKIILGKE
jgi:hypothetical protein